MKKKVANKKIGRRLVQGSSDLTDIDKIAVRSVKEYETARRLVDMYVEEHADVLKPYQQLVEELETKRQAAELAMRSTNGGSFGDFECFSESKKYYPDKLFGHIGRDKFIALGGEIVKETVYKLAPEKIDLGIASGQIPKSIVDDVKQVTPKYRVPK